MTATTFTRLPLLAGSAVATSLGRSGLWVLSRYMRAPLASTGLLAMVTLTALAGSNALYFQTARHPAPLFAPSPLVPEPVPMAQPEPQLAVPAPARQQAVSSQPAAAETTGSVAPTHRVVPSEPVGNEEMFAVQKKLVELGLFEGDVDGFYGPMTARAIRAFEERNGLTPMGAASREIMDAILRADAAGMAQVQQVAAAVVTPPAPVTRSAAEPTGDRVVARLPDIGPAEAVLDTVGNAAAETIDSIVAAVDGSRQTPPAPAVTPIPAMPLVATNTQPMPAPVVQQVSNTTPVHAPSYVPANDTELVMQVQRGLASLGFLHAPIDGQPGEATAKAIRTFEIWHRYEVTGQIRPDLPRLLQEAGADIG